MSRPSFLLYIRMGFKLIHVCQHCYCVVLWPTNKRDGLHCLQCISIFITASYCYLYTQSTCIHITHQVASSAKTLSIKHQLHFTVIINCHCTSYLLNITVLHFNHHFILHFNHQSSLYFTSIIYLNFYNINLILLQSLHIHF